MKQVYISSEHSNTPLSGAYEVNGLVFISGQIHADAEWKLHGETATEKFEIVMNNVQKVLKEVGLELKDVVHVRIYVTDIKELPEINGVYKEYFSHPMPARTAIGVTALPLGASIEIEVVASRS